MKIRLGDTEIGSIPREWEVIRLENVIKELRNGFASGKRDDDGIVQIRMNNVTTDGHLIFNSFLKVPAPENINEFLLKENDLLFNNTNSIDLVGKSTIFKNVSFPCTFSNHFTRFRFSDEVLPEWVLFNFITLWGKGYFKSVAIRHVGQSAVQTKYLTNLRIPLPPLPEQKKIAEILSTLDQAIGKVDEAIKKTQRLKNGLMQELLTKGIGHKEFKDTEIGKVPKEWEVVRLSNVFKLASGKSRPKEISDKQTDKMPIPVYGGNGVLGYTNKFMVDNETVVIGRVGEYCGSIHKTLKSSWITDNALYAAVIEKCQISLDFFTYYLVFINLNKFKKESGQPLMTQTIVYSISCPLPPLPEQQKIAEILSTVDERLDLFRKRKERLERTKKGLMNDLLTGKKRVQLEV